MFPVIVFVARLRELKKVFDSNKETKPELAERALDGAMDLVIDAGDDDCISHTAANKIRDWMCWTWQSDAVSNYGFDKLGLPADFELRP